MKTSRNSDRFFACLCLALVVGCADSAPERERKVLFIGIDGVRPDALALAETPNLDSLIARGSFSPAAQTVIPSFSGPGWSSMLTGVFPDKHNVVTNLFLDPDYERFPHFFTRLKEARPELVTASIVHWSPINSNIVSDADFVAEPVTDEGVMEEAAELLRSGDPDVLFLHFDDCDLFGHAYGFSPEVSEYVAAIAKVDTQIGVVLEALAARPTIDSEEWLILSSTDHGGLGRLHGGITAEEMTIFVLVSGDAATGGVIEPAPAIVDLAPTALKFLGVEADPGWELDGSPVGLR
jgi:predicted AlkP superfamily pyrophosphatase or phosphodiesterase